MIFKLIVVLGLGAQIELLALSCPGTSVQVLSPLLETLSRAKVVLGTQAGITDSAGFTCLTVLPGHYDLTVSVLGFRRFVKRIEIGDDKTQFIAVLQVAPVHEADAVQHIRGRIVFRLDEREPYWITVNHLLGDLLARTSINSDGTFAMSVRDIGGRYIARVVSRSAVVASIVFDVDAGDKYLEIEKSGDCLSK